MTVPYRVQNTGYSADLPDANLVDVKDALFTGQCYEESGDIGKEMNQERG